MKHILVSIVNQSMSDQTIIIKLLEYSAKQGVSTLCTERNYNYIIYWATIYCRQKICCRTDSHKGGCTPPYQSAKGNPSRAQTQERGPPSTPVEIS